MSTFSYSPWAGKELGRAVPTLKKIVKNAPKTVRDVAGVVKYLPGVGPMTRQAAGAYTGAHDRAKDTPPVAASEAQDTPPHGGMTPGMFSYAFRGPRPAAPQADTSFESDPMERERVREATFDRDTMERNRAARARQADLIRNKQLRGYDPGDAAIAADIGSELASVKQAHGVQRRLRNPAQARTPEQNAAAIRDVDEQIYRELIDQKRAVDNAGEVGPTAAHLREFDAERRLTETDYGARGAEATANQQKGADRRNADTNALASILREEAEERRLAREHEDAMERGGRGLELATVRAATEQTGRQAEPNWQDEHGRQKGELELEAMRGSNERERWELERDRRAKDSPYNTDTIKANQTNFAAGLAARAAGTPDELASRVAQNIETIGAGTGGLGRGNQVRGDIMTGDAGPYADASADLVADLGHLEALKDADPVFVRSLAQKSLDRLLRKAHGKGEFSGERDWFDNWLETLAPLNIPVAVRKIPTMYNRLVDNADEYNRETASNANTAIAILRRLAGQ